jgi:hypothetical protein
MISYTPEMARAAQDQRLAAPHDVPTTHPSHPQVHGYIRDRVRRAVQKARAIAKSHSTIGALVRH